jgi:hypothetical protein
LGVFVNRSLLSARPLARALAALACAALTACAQALPDAGDARDAEEHLAPAQRAVTYGEHPHVLKLNRDGAHAPVQGDGAAAGGPNLQYYGGHVISNVRVNVVFWGGNVDSTVQSQIGAFYQGITDGAYMDWLREYDTDVNAVGGQPGTNQHLGRGSYGGSFTIAPSVSGNVTNDQIQTELARQIASGALPPNDENSIYMIYFPAGVAISLPDGKGGNATSCQQFCAFHNTMQINGRSVYYAVMPDLGSDLLCIVGCGTPFDTFNNTTSASSHELIEAVTDAEVGLAQSYGPPLGWYDTSRDAQGNERGEIGDICNGQRGSATGRDGKAWVVQKEWSNAAGACIDQGSAATPQPPSVTVKSPHEGDTLSGVVTLSATAVGNAGATIAKLEMFVDNAPVGSSTSGTVNLSWDAGKVGNGAHAIAAVATDSAGLTGTSGTVHVVVHNHLPPADYVKNGGFEGSIYRWTTGGKAPIDSVVKAHSGKNSLRCGATPTVKPNGDSFAYQQLTVPAAADSATLTFWTWSTVASTSADYVEALVRDGNGAVLQTVFHAADNSQAWKQQTVDLSAYKGRTIQLYFNAHGTASAPATMWVDDVSVLAR